MTTNPSRPAWLRDELVGAGRENLDDAHVARYDAIEDADAAAEVAYLRARGLRAASIVVEFGTGTGQFALEVADQCGRVIAVDVSPPMLRALSAKLGRRRLGNVDVVRAGFLTYEHQGEPADVVYTRYALHHLPDFWKGVALTRMHRLLRPGGLLRVWDVVYHFDPADAERVLEAWCATAPVDDLGQWSRADLEEHVRDEHSTYTWVFEALAQRAGFAIEEASYSDDAIFAKYLFRRT